MNPRTTLRWLLPTLAVSCLAVWVRTTHIADAGLSSDETFSWRLTRYAAPEVVRRTAADVHPPLGYLLLKGWTAAFGTSPVGLRSFSVVLGLLTIAILALVAFEHERHHAGAAPTNPGLAAALAAFFVAVSEAQISASRNARMYELGLLLSALSALLLLRALRAERWRIAAWVAYGTCAAALVYTHYYGAFTLVAQGVWALGRAGLRYQAGQRGAAVRDVLGLALGAAIATTLFAPWLPVLRAQSGEVWKDYWIPALSAEGVARGLVDWGAGSQPFGWAGVVAVLGATTFLAWRGRPGAFFTLQASVPWLCGILLSSLSARSVFLTRYMIFAQLGLFGLWAVSFARTPRGWQRTLALAALAIVSCSALPASLRAYAASEAIEPKAIRFLARQGHPGDLVLVDSPFRVNRLAYYAAQEGLQGVAFRCLLDRTALGRGHVPHLSSLAEGDIVWRDELPRLEVGRIWWGGPDEETWPDPPPAWSPRYTRPFRSAVTRAFALTLYLPAGADAGTPP